MCLQESAIRKLDHTVASTQGVDFIRLNIGQPDVATPQAVLDAIASFQPKVIAYGPSSGTPACRQAAAAYHARWSPGLDVPHVAVTTGGSEALLFAFTAICDPGEELVVPEPYYTNYNGFASVAGVSVRPIPTPWRDGVGLPPDDVLDASITDKTRGIVYSNPGNPTGAVLGETEVARLLAWAARNDLYVVADEVYRRIWFDQAPASALSFEEHRDRVIAIDSMSKTYSSCGLRLGFLISRNADLMARVERLGQARLGPQPLAQAAAEAALSVDVSYYDDVRTTYSKRVARMMAAVGSIPGAVAPDPGGAFYSMVALPIQNSERFARFLVEDFRHEGQTVVVAPGGGFYSESQRGAREIRLAAVCETDRLVRGVELMGMGLQAYLQSGNDTR